MCGILFKGNLLSVLTHHLIGMDIDLVYLWVDGSDPVWRAKKNAFEKGTTQITDEARNYARFVDNDELKYSLRSVEMYAPWVRHIYIVTDGQIPTWLNLKNPRISIINHSQIMPKEALPSFSSPAIEWCIDNIPGLSEHFLYANDDTFIGRKVNPSFFFNEKGQPIVRLKSWTSSKRNISLYLKTVARAQKLIQQHFGKFIKYIPHHNIDAYRKCDIKKCKELFPEQISQTIHRHFRSEEDLQRVVVQYYTLVTGNGELRRMSRYNHTTSLIEKIISLLQKNYNYDSRRITITVPNIQSILDKYNPALFCLNDGENADDECRQRARNFLEKKFSHKSSFEL